MIEGYGGIYSVSINNITENSAIVTWRTFERGTTELRLGVQQPDGNYIYSLLPKISSSNTCTHEYPLSNLSPLTNYRAEAMTFDEMMGSYVPCDDGSNPATFTTLGSSGPVDYIEVFAQSYMINQGETIVISGNAQSSQGAAYGREVSFSIVNGSPGGEGRGIFNPANTVTDNQGDFSVFFTGTHNGKAKIAIKVEDVIVDLEIMILPNKNREKKK